MSLRRRPLTRLAAMAEADLFAELHGCSIRMYHPIVRDSGVRPFCMQNVGSLHGSPATWPAASLSPLNRINTSKYRPDSRTCQICGSARSQTWKGFHISILHAEIPRATFRPRSERHVPHGTASRSAVPARVSMPRRVRTAANSWRTVINRAYRVVRAKLPGGHHRERADRRARRSGAGHRGPRERRRWGVGGAKPPGQGEST